jgi:Holliday junction DNA helicase RuvA
MPKFALMVVREEPRDSEVPHDIVNETYEVLRSLGHSESDARRLIEAALADKKRYKDVQELLQAVYQKNRQ